MNLKDITRLIPYIIILLVGQCYSFDNIITYLGTSRTRKSSFTKYTPWNSRATGIIKFKFITSNPNGLLLHVGDSDKINWTRNYLQLRVKHGMLNLISRIKNGSKIIQWKRIWFDKEVDDLRWHEVTVMRNRMRVFIELDGVRKQVQFGVMGMQPVNLKGVIYIAGFPNAESSKCGTISRTDQFVGAIKNLAYGPLPTNPNLGKILDKQGIVYGYSDHCTDKTPRYYMCQHKGVCVNKFNDYSCNCLGTGFEGRTCGIKSTSLHLKGLDYLEWKPMNHQHSSQSNNIAVRFKTTEPFGVLFYVGNSTKYLTVEIYKGHLIVGICLNYERLTINASLSIMNNDHWHLVEVSRREMNLKVTINKTHIVERNIPGRHSNRIIDDTNIFIGGNNYLNWLSGTLSKQYFMGCLQQVYYNGGNIVNSVLPSHNLHGRRYGNIVFGCPVRTTKPPFTRMIRSKRYRPTPPRRTINANKSKLRPPTSPGSHKKIDNKSKTFLIVGITVGSIVLIVIISATIHYLRSRYRKEMVLTAVYTKPQHPNGTSSATTSVFISPSSSGGASSYKSNYYIK